MCDGVAKYGVYASIVTYETFKLHGELCLKKCLAAMLGQKGFKAGENLSVHLHDNGSKDGLWRQISAEYVGSGVNMTRSSVNLGFAGGHNRNVREFLEGEAGYFLMLNPDVALKEDALAQMVGALESCPQAGAAAPRLYRTGPDLVPLEPPMLDAAGMYITPALRHFDRGSGEADRGQYRERCFVFGGSGACLLLRRRFIEEALLDGGEKENLLGRVYPELLPGRERRAQLFDEAFFAYREDADLAWRGLLLGWKCIYVPEAVGWHKRVVLPERRSELPAELNLFSVRNRFLLQINNFFLFYSWPAVLPGLLLRNLMVILGAVLLERSSLPGLKHVVKLAARARTRRGVLRARIKVKPAEMARWFRRRPHTERLD